MCCVTLDQIANQKIPYHPSLFDLLVSFLLKFRYEDPLVGRNLVWPRHMIDCRLGEKMKGVPPPAAFGNLAFCNK